MRTRQAESSAHRVPKSAQLILICAAAFFIPLSLLIRYIPETRSCARELCCAASLFFSSLLCSTRARRRRNNVGDLISAKRTRGKSFAGVARVLFHFGLWEKPALCCFARAGAPRKTGLWIFFRGKFRPSCFLFFFFWFRVWILLAVVGINTKVRRFRFVIRILMQISIIDKYFSFVWLGVIKTNNYLIIR